MGVPTFSLAVGVLLGLLILWSIVWKGLALWRAAKRGDMIWFIIFLVLNTAGILEIIYLFFVAKAKLSDFAISQHSHKS
jgi:methionyl-tRNA synthetase